MGLINAVRRSTGLQRVMLLTGLTLTTIFIVTALFAPWLAPHGYSELLGAQESPGREHLLGTTIGGYDVLSRVIWGTRTAAEVIVLAVVVSIVPGVLLGLVSGYFGGRLDRFLVALADIMYAFPQLLLAIVTAIAINGGRSSLWGGLISTAVAVGIGYAPQYFRVVRAEVVRVSAEPFVEAAQVIGTGTLRIMLRHVLRNSTRTLPLMLTINASYGVLTLAGLGFLGFGIEPTSAAEWGYDLNKSVSDVTAGIWWTAIPPGVAIMLTSLGITLVGEGLNDLADPRLRRRRRTRARTASLAGLPSPTAGDDA